MQRGSLLFLLLSALALAAGKPPLFATPITGTMGVDPNNIAGTHPSGRLLLYAPNPLEPGSSVSHFDVSATPNLLMEPSINSNLSFLQTDLTTLLLRDEGWSSGTSTITIRVMDPSGQGFNDPSLGAQRLAALERAAGAWASRLRSSVQINVEASFSSLQCDTTGGVLAQAGAQFLFESFPGAPISGTWYHGALAEALAGDNLSLQDIPTPNAGDLALTFNDQIDQACLGGGSRFYYGLNANIPAGQISFANVALHEMAHGLGFSSFTNPATGTLFMGMPDIYSRFIFDADQGQTWNQMNNAQRRSSAINTGQLMWNGNRVTAQAPNFLDPAPALTLTSPASIAGIYTVGIAAFGPPLGSPGVSGDLVLALDGSATPTLLCQASTNTSELAGNIAVVDRGTCNFSVKVKNAQNAGAVGVVVINNAPGPPTNMSGTDPTVTIPSVHVSQSDGDLIKATLATSSNPGVLSFSATSFSASEGAGSAAVTVRRTGGTDGAVAVDFATADDSATAGADYLPAMGTLSFNDGQAGTRSFQVQILDDTLSEGEERVDVVLSNPTGGASLGARSSVSLLIADDDLNPAGFLAFSAADFQAGEGDAAAVVTVERTGGSAGAVSIDFATGGGSAVAGADYQATSGTIDFADGETGAKSFDVPLVDDDVEESIETIGLALSNPTGGALLGTPSTARVNVTDNEACQPNDTRLCLNQGRFRVEVSWRDFQNGTGAGQVVTESDDSGLLWFFDADNWEMLVKVLDGCAINDRFWVFAAATTNVAYTLTVTDSLTGDVRQFDNALGVAAPAITDTDAFDTCAAGGGSALAPATRRETATGGRGRSSASTLKTQAAPGSVAPKAAKVAPCVADATRLCLNQGRFQVDVNWRDFQNQTGPGQVVFDSDDSGLLWFFDADNWEMLVKVLDGCTINSRFWVFAAATTNVEFTLQVTDTTTGDVFEVVNPLGVSSPSITDTDAFDTCP